MQYSSYVVTGGNKGIGLAIVKQILKKIDNSFVFLGSRSVERGNQAINVFIITGNNSLGNKEN